MFLTTYHIFYHMYHRLKYVKTWSRYHVHEKSEGYRVFMLELIMMKLLLGGLHLIRYIGPLDHLRMIHNTYRDYEESVSNAGEYMSKHAQLVELHENRSTAGVVASLLTRYPDQMAMLIPRLMDMIPMISSQVLRTSHTEIIDE